MSDAHLARSVASGYEFRAMRLQVYGALMLLAACGAPQITVTPPLGVIDFAPQDGATNVDPAAQEGVCFNQSVDASNLGVQVSIQDASGAQIPGLAVANAQANGQTDTYCLALSHSPLSANALYDIVVPQGLQATTGQVLAATIRSRFRTAGP